MRIHFVVVRQWKFARKSPMPGLGEGQWFLSFRMLLGENLKIPATICHIPAELTADDLPP